MEKHDNNIDTGIDQFIGLTNQSISARANLLGQKKQMQDINIPSNIDLMDIGDQEIKKWNQLNLVPKV